MIETHYYIYTFKDNKYFFDRTMSSRFYAEYRVKELQTQGKYAVYLINHVIKDAFY